MDLYAGVLSDLLYPEDLPLGRRFAALRCAVLASGEAVGVVAKALDMPCVTGWEATTSRLESQGRLEALDARISQVADRLREESTNFARRRDLSRSGILEPVVADHARAPQPVVRQWLWEEFASSYRHSTGAPANPESRNRLAPDVTDLEVSRGDELRAALRAWVADEEIVA